MPELLLLLLLLPLIPLVAVVLHASPIKATLGSVKSVLASVLSAVWKPQQPIILVTDLATAHRLLVRGAGSGYFSNRPPSISPSAILSRRRYQNITSAPYGQHWRAMRHNLTSEILHPARLHRYAAARRRAVRGLVHDLSEQRRLSGAVQAGKSIHYAMFSLVAAMCFGDGLDRGRVRAMADEQRDLGKSLDAALVFADAKFLAVTRLIYRKQWKKLAALRQKQEETFLPLIDSRRGQSSEPPAYVDTLVDLEVPEECPGASSARRRLSDGELVGMCSEFLGTGTESTASALQWTKANLVKRPHLQEAVRREIDAVVAADAEEVSEDVLGKLEYLNAVIMEALRLHPPTSWVFRQVMEEDHVVHNGHRVPAGTRVFFQLGALARDSAAWDDPDEFKPERFLAGSKGEQLVLAAAVGGDIKMMPFGGGRRMCPARDIAMLHIRYFAANLVREFHWREAEGDLAVDLEPQAELIFSAMKHPLRAHLDLGRPGVKTTQGTHRL